MSEYKMLLESIESYIASRERITVEDARRAVSAIRTLSARAERAEREKAEAVAAERDRCINILSLARGGQIDGDLRSLIHRIKSGVVHD